MFVIFYLGYLGKGTQKKLMLLCCWHAKSK